MKKTLFLLLVILTLSALALSACGGGSAATEAAPKLDRPAPPAEYASKTNPHAGDSAAASSGKTTYDTNCASCHGSTGQGDGPAAASLDPKPQPLAANEAGLTDAYMLWRISEGGAFAPFNSVMPSWKGTLSEEQIWQVITYIRTLKP